MTDNRPDPDLLLAQVQREEGRRRAGRLFIFLGMCPGVGKTYAMLLAARQRQAEGLRVLAGIVETHGRVETAALLDGLETLPRKQIEHNGHLLEEFDLDTALVRRPDLLLVDELAHTNAPGVATRSAIRTYLNCSPPASTSAPRSTSSTSRAKWTWSDK